MGSEPLDPRPFEVASDGTRLSGEEVGEGPPVVLLHGLTATRRYVLHGSVALARRGYRLISYDARGHANPRRRSLAATARLSPETCAP